MRRFMQLGEVPRKRHMRFEHEGKNAFEELLGREGFSGPSSLLYHRHMPEGAHDVSAGGDDLSPAAEHEHIHEHAHIEGHRLQPHGDVISGRQWLLVNEDVRIGLALPHAVQGPLYVNGSADEVLFVHHGTGVLHTQFGRIAFSDHDYLVIPRGTIHRFDFEALDDVRILCLEITGLVDTPDRYRARTGQLLEIAPYSERDFHGPEALEVETGEAEVLLKRFGRFSRYQLDNHPFDVIGWDGTVYPVRFNIHDFEARAGRFHVPPPIHQTFQAHNLVICSFVPRKLDWDEQAVFLPYHHSNLESDEVLYYVDGHYAARRGIKQASLTHHVGGVPHGPQPGALEASFDRPRETDELAVMVDTFRPLYRTETARTVLDKNYPYSWHTGGVRGSESIA